MGRGKIAVHEQHHRYDHRDDRRDQAPVDIKDRSFRLRRLEVEPGGIVPWHNHADRPAIAYLLEGKLTEYASNCAVPVEHTAGDVIVETPNLSHWWKNFGDKRAVVISADLLKGKDDNM
jgi:quercetin dioxygenase-like cupin family protein